MLYSAKESVYIFLCLKTLCKAHFKSNGLIGLVKISRQHGVQAVTWASQAVLN